MATLVEESDYLTTWLFSACWAILSAVMAVYPFVFKPATAFTDMSSTVTVAPFTWRVGWRLLMVFPELFFSVKIATLGLMLGILTLVFLLLADPVEKMFVLIVWFLGSQFFLYPSDCLVLLGILYYRVNLTTRWAWLAALVKEDLLIYSLFCTTHRFKWFGVPVFLLLRILFHADYRPPTTTIQIINYLTYNRQLIACGVSLLILIVTMHYLLFTIDYQAIKWYAVFWIFLCVVFGNVWETNKYWGLLLQRKKLKTPVSMHYPELLTSQELDYLDERYGTSES